MPRTYSRIILHTVFSTKYRQPLIDPEKEDGLYRAIGQRFKENKCELIRINGGFDHIHAVHSLSRTVSVADLLQDVKSRSSYWMRNHYPFAPEFWWQVGYYSVSVDHRNLDGLLTYVDNQKRHHYGSADFAVIQKTFEQEYAQLLTAYGFDFDPAKEFDLAPESR